MKARQFSRAVVVGRPRSALAPMEQAASMKVRQSASRAS